MQILLLLSFICFSQAIPKDIYNPDVNNEAVYMHNWARRQKARDNGASSMSYMELDESLISRAENWAAKCSKAAQLYTAQSVVWSDETSNIKSLFYLMYKNLKIYKQMIFDIANRVGCAYKKCDGFSYLVCNYNRRWDGGLIFAKGKACSECNSYENFCFEGLCARKLFFMSQLLYTTNLARSALAKTKPVSNMQKIYWDKNVQFEAEKRAEKCIWDANDSIFALKGNHETNIGKWGSFIARKLENEGYSIKDYPPSLWAKTNGIGAAYAQCKGELRLYYGYAYSPGNYHNPFTVSKPCSKCPADKKRCSNSLCDF